MTDSFVKRYAEKQRRRFVASVLGAAEQSPWWPRLSQGEQRAYRDKILTSVGVYHDFILDVIRVSEESDDANNVMRNEHAVTLLTQVAEGQRTLIRQLQA